MTLDVDLAGVGLHILGGFEVSEADGDLPHSPITGDFPKIGLMVGNAGSALWPILQDSAEARDGHPHPLDRWTQRIITELCERKGLSAVYPFGGPPWWPFVTWAKRTGQFSPSPLGVLVHQHYGPWSAFRGVILGDETLLELAPAGVGSGPCPTCMDKPCLTVCPVNAISLDEPYDYKACRSHVTTSWPAETADGDQPTCSTGCLARKACPVGTEYRYAPAHGRFHMAAFRG